MPSPRSNAIAIVEMWAAEKQQWALADAQKSTYIAQLQEIDLKKTERIARLERRIEQIQHALAQFKRTQFGKKAESTDALGRQGELFERIILELEQELKTLTPAENTGATATAPLKKVSAQPKAPPRVTLPPNLRVEIVELDIAEADKFAADGTALKYIGDDISEKVAMTPAEFFIKRTVRKKYANRQQEECGIIAAPLHDFNLGGIADISVAVDVVLRKYDDHLPLNRIAEIYKRDHRVDFAKQTLCDLVLHTSVCVAPVADAIFGQLLTESVLHVDETTLPLLQPGKTQSARAWAYVGAESGLISYAFTGDKKGEHVRTALRDWKPSDGMRYLQADAASNYNALYLQRPVLEVACWAHARRKFFDVAHAAPNAPTAYQAVVTINKLFAIERECTESGNTPAQRKEARALHAKPILDAFAPWLAEQLMELAPKSPTAGAVGYCLRNWTAFTQYLNDGRIRIDNNAAERALRVVAVGRKNWLFAGSENGGIAAARMYTLIESAKACGLNPRDYLQDVLFRLPSTLITNIRELLPQNWKPAR